MNSLLLRVHDVFMYEGCPCVVLAPSMDESSPTRRFSESRIDCAKVNMDGSLGKQFVLDRSSYTEKKPIQPIDNAKVTIHVELPQDIIEQVEDYTKQESTIKPDSDEINEYHPSYGNIQLSRQNGSTRLFMSPFRHQHYICISIGRASKHRSHANDRMFSSCRKVVEVYLSEAQFARFITNPMDGNGTPCTIRNVTGTFMPEPPGGDEVERFHADIEKDAVKAAAGIDEALKFAESLLDKPTVSKQDRNKLIGMIRSSQMSIIDSMPFVVQQMRERMEKVVADAQTEIEAHINNVIINTGLKAIAEQGVPITMALEAPKKED